jgi:hypothetical protein
VLCGEWGVVEFVVCGSGECWDMVYVGVVKRVVCVGLHGGCFVCGNVLKLMSHCFLT